MENITYDKHGNIQTMKLYGRLEDINKMGLVDNLTMEYTGNQLNRVEDTAADINRAGSMDFKNKVSPAGTIEYTYNRNGAMVSDLNKGITAIQYNSLNLPQAIEVASPSVKGRIKYTYSAIGVKLKTVHETDMNVQTATMMAVAPFATETTDIRTTDYIGNKVYENGVLKMILVDGGYIEGGTYHFYMTDHLGNNRVVAKADGTQVQKTHYYPFGSSFGVASGTSTQPYKYNGKELDKKHGLNLYDYSARYYESAIGRFTTVDSLAESYYNWSPYVYCLNDPIKHSEPDGEAPILGAIVGGALDYAFQVTVNYASGKTGSEAWTDVSLTSIAVSTAAGTTGVGLANVVKGITATKLVQNGSKAVKVATAIVANASTDAAVSVDTQLAKTGEVDATSVAIDVISGQIGSKIKSAKQKVLKEK